MPSLLHVPCPVSSRPLKSRMSTSSMVDLFAPSPLDVPSSSGRKEIFVLHVGRLEQRLEPPKRPWQVALVAFEIARRHHFEEELAALPDGVDLHVLPSGSSSPSSVSVRYRTLAGVGDRIDAAFQATARYLDNLPA